MASLRLSIKDSEEEEGSRVLRCLKVQVMKSTKVLFYLKNPSAVLRLPLGVKNTLVIYSNPLEEF